MDERTRQIFERAYEAIDRVDAAQAEREAERAAETLFQRVDRENREAVELRARIDQRKQQAEPPQMIRKTFVTPSQQPRTTTMDPATEAKWNAWLDRRVTDIGKLIVQVCAEQLRIERDKLREEIGQLRAEIETLRAHNVTPIGRKGGSNVA